MCFRLRFRCRVFYKIFQKKRFRKQLQQRVPPTAKQVAIDMSSGSQRDRLACALLKQEITARVQNTVSNLLPLPLLQQIARNVLCIGVHCKCIKKMFEGNDMDQCQEHSADDLTRPWPRPGEFQNNAIN